MAREEKEWTAGIMFVERGFTKPYKDKEKEKAHGRGRLDPGNGRKAVKHDVRLPNPPKVV